MTGHECESLEERFMSSCMRGRPASSVAVAVLTARGSRPRRPSRAACRGSFARSPPIYDDPADPQDADDNRSRSLSNRNVHHIPRWPTSTRGARPTGHRYVALIPSRRAGPPQPERARSAERHARLAFLSIPSHADQSFGPPQNKSLPGLLEKLNIIPRGPDKDDSALDTLSESSIDGGVSSHIALTCPRARD